MMNKRTLSFLLALLMVVGMIPTPAYAADSTEATTEPTVVTTAATTEPTTATTAATTEPTVPETTVETVNDVVAAPAALDFTTADYIGDIGKFAKLNDVIILVKETEPNVSQDAAEYYPDEFSEDTLFKITNVKVLEESFDLTDEETGEVIGQKKVYTLWYQVEVLDGTVPEDFADGYWILQNYLNEEDAYDTNTLVLSDPADHTWCDTCNKYDCGIDHDASEPSEPEEEPVTKTETTSSGTTVGVRGVLPEGTQLSVSDATINAIEFGIEDPDSVLAAVDIKLLSADDMEYQPYTDESEVMVTLDAADMGLKDGDIVKLHHKHDGTITVYEPYVVIGGKLTFWTDRFSVYVVSSVTDTEPTSAEIANGSTYTIELGQTIVFYENTPQNNNNTNRGLWKVEDPSNAIVYSVIHSGVDSWGNPVFAPWIELTAKDQGDVTLTHTFLSADGKTTTTTITVKIVAPEPGQDQTYDLYVDDQVAENGCLVPAWSGSTPGAVRYTWTRSDDQVVRPEALHDDGKVNVSIDRGGVYDGEEPITYTLAAYDQNDNVLDTATFTVLYGHEILNSSFEEPGVTLEFTSHKTVHNGYPGLYWKTTAPGSGNTLGMDVELGHTVDNPYGIGAAADGDYFAEINAEQFGALYQDILTTPGANLSWSFSHGGRTDAPNNNMYIVMAATEDASQIIDFASINALLSAIPDGATIPSSGEGYELTYNGATYRIWYSSADKGQWKTVSGSYTIPSDQYLTRLFFASDTKTGGSTVGNLIDGVYAGEQMDYVVEYYVDNQVQQGHEQRGFNIRPNTFVPLENLDNYLKKYTYPTSILVNGRNYPGTLADLKQGLYITDYGTKTGDLANRPEQIILQIFFQEPNIIVTKIVNPVGMSSEQKNQILNTEDNGKYGFWADFQLENKNDADDKFTAGVEITRYSSSGTLTSESSFKDSTGKYVSVADYGKTFTVSETNAKEIENYKRITTIKTGNDRNNLTSGYEVQITEDNEIAYVEVTNTYYPLGDLRVSKFVQSNFPGIEINDSQKTQEFTFTVTLSGMTDQIPASLRGPYNYTIKEYADGAVPSAQDKQVSTGESTLSENNTLTFTLKHNQYIVIEDLPAGAYTITETQPSGYQQPNFIYENDNAVIPVGDTADVKCYNTPEITVGDLELTKNVVDNSASQNAPMPDKGFEFTVMLNGAYNPITEGTPFKVTYSCDAEKGTLSGDSITYTLKKNSNTYQLAQTVTPVFDADDSYTFHISLYDGLTATIEDLPPCSYSVQEADYSALKYGTTYTGDNGTLGGTNNAVSEVVCTNTYPINTGNLKITKTVQKEYDPDPMGAATFTFIIEPVADSTVDLGNSYAVKIGNGDLQNINVVDSKLTVTIPFTAAEMANVSKAQPAVKELMVYDLPMGQYTVTEEVVSGYDQMNPNQTVTIAAEPAETDFLNILERITGAITIKKTVTGTNEADTFLFHLKGTDEHTNHIDMDVTITGSGSVMIQDLPIGNYTVTEDTSWNWRYTTNPPSGSTTATLTADAPLVEVDFTNTLTNNKWLNFVTTMKNTFQH